MRSLTHTISQKKYNQPMGELNPLSLFRNGEQGVWYDPSDIKLGWRKNLLVQSEDLTSPVWSKSQATVSGNKIIPSTVDTIHYVTQHVSTLYAGETYTLSLQAINSGYDWLSIECHTGVAYLYLKFNVNNGTIGSISAGLTATNPTLIDGKWALSVTMATPVSSSTPRFTIFVSPTINLSYAGDGTSGVIVDKIQVERGVSATAYQKITDGIQDYYTYHPLPTLYQDSAGTTPVTAVEQPVGLMLDKSKNIALGASVVTAGSSWTVTAGTGLSISGLTVTGTGGTGTLRLPGCLTQGVRYRVTQRITSYTSGSITGVYDGNSGKFVSGLGSFPYITIGSTNDLYVYTDGFVGVLQIELVQAISGNHASQSTSASRPTLSARYNLATYSELVGIGANPWGAANFILEERSLALPAGVVGPSYLTKLTATSTPAATAYQMNCPATQLTVTFYAHIGTRSVVNFLIRNGTTATVVYGGQLDTNGVSGANFSGVNLGGGIYRVTVDVVTGFSVGDQFQVYYGATGAVPAGLYWYVGGMDIRVKLQAGVPIYQKVVTSSDYDTVGFPIYLKCDGVDDGMATNSINFAGVTKLVVSGGIRTLSTSFGIIAETSPSYSGSTGAWELSINEVSAGTYAAAYRGSGANNYAIQSSAGATPRTSVVSSYTDTSILASSGGILIRENSIQSTVSANGGPTGTVFGNYPLYLFRRAGSSLPFNGYMYGLIIRGATTPTATIQKIEKYMNKKVGKIY